MKKNASVVEKLKRSDMNYSKINWNKCPLCGSYNYTVGFFTTGHNCKCSDCGALWYYNFKKEMI